MVINEIYIYIFRSKTKNQIKNKITVGFAIGISLESEDWTFCRQKWLQKK